MQVPHSFSIAGEQLWLSDSRVVFWERTRTLILSDTHFGKTGHFRKAGIGVPQTVFMEDLQRLFSLIQYFQPVRLLVVGDFFHSTANKEAELFARWRHDHAGLEIELVRGNHDILPVDWYRRQDICLHDNILTDGPFGFIHAWNEFAPDNNGPYFFSGHIHPGIRLRGPGRQQVMLPCFYFGQQHAILPAFGGFTGLATLQPGPGDRVFVIGNKQLISL